MTTTTLYAVRFSLSILPPSVNHMYKSIGQGRKALTDEATTFRQYVCLALRGERTPPPEPLALSIWLTVGKKKGRTLRTDGDNRIKSLQDAIAIALGFDDSQIVEWHVFAERGETDRCEALLEVRE